MHKYLVSFLAVGLVNVTTINGVNLAFQNTHFEPSGRNIVRTAEVVNNSMKMRPTQLSVQKWRLDNEGSDVITDSGNDFTIQPSQLLLRPNERRTVMIRYTGDADITQEETYRFSALEIALTDATPKKKYNITILQNMVQIIYVTKSEFKPNLELTKVALVDIATPTTDGKGSSSNVKSQFFKLDFTNSGTAHFINKGLKVVLYPPASTHERVLEIDIPNLAILLAKSTRTILIPWPEKMNTRTWTGKIVVPE